MIFSVGALLAALPLLHLFCFVLVCGFVVDRDQGRIRRVL